MDYLLICSVALIVSALTLFSGFGLGTLLMPAFALFFPLPLAIAATAVVHLANNLFKAGLVGRYGNGRVAVRFGLPAAAAAIIGASLLSVVAGIETLLRYEIGGRMHEVTVLKLLIGALIVGFAGAGLAKSQINRAPFARFLVAGGLISGFIGGLSGHHGALRSAFLIRAGLSKQAFIGTGVICAILVDAARLAVYGLLLQTGRFTALEEGMAGLLAAGVAASFLGAYIGARLLGRVTFHFVEITVALMLCLVGAGLMSGLI